MLIRKNFLNCQKLKKEAKKKDYGADFKVQKTSLQKTQLGEKQIFNQAELINIQDQQNINDTDQAAGKKDRHGFIDRGLTNYSTKLYSQNKNIEVVEKKNLFHDIFNTKQQKTTEL